MSLQSSNNINPYLPARGFANHCPLPTALRPPGPAFHLPPHGYCFLTSTSHSISLTSSAPLPVTAVHVRFVQARTNFSRVARTSERHYTTCGKCERQFDQLASLERVEDLEFIFGDDYYSLLFSSRPCAEYLPHALCLVRGDGQVQQVVCAVKGPRVDACLEHEVLLCVVESRQREEVLL